MPRRRRPGGRRRPGRPRAGPGRGPSLGGRPWSRRGRRRGPDGRASCRPASAPRGGMAGRARGRSARRDAPARGPRRAVAGSCRLGPPRPRWPPRRGRGGGPPQSRRAAHHPRAACRSRYASTAWGGKSPRGATPWWWGGRGGGGVWWQDRGGDPERARDPHGRGDKPATQQPSACLRLTQGAAVLGLQGGGPCPLLHRPPEGLTTRGGAEQAPTGPWLTEAGGTDRERPWRGGGTVPLWHTCAGPRGLTRLHLAMRTAGSRRETRARLVLDGSPSCACEHSPQNQQRPEKKAAECAGICNYAWKRCPR